MTPLPTTKRLYWHSGGSVVGYSGDPEKAWRFVELDEAERLWVEHVVKAENPDAAEVDRLHHRRAADELADAIHQTWKYHRAVAADAAMMREMG